MPQWPKTLSVAPIFVGGRKSEMGQTRKWPGWNGMSVLPSRADVVRPPRHDLGQRSVAKRSAPRLMAFGERTLLVVSTGRFTAGVIARSHGRLSARVLGDSPISASLPPTSLPVLQATRRRI